VNINRIQKCLFRLLHVGVLVALLWGSLPTLCSVAEDRRSVVFIPEKAFEFGSVSEGTIVSHDFEIRNTGSADLQIQRIAPACGCTAATVTSPIIGPGKSEKIRVKFDTAGFSGSKFKQIHVFTSDKDLSDIVFTLRGTILSEVKVEPATLDFGDVSRTSSEGSRRQQFTVSLEQDSGLRVARASSSSQSVRVTEIARRQGSTVFGVELLPTVRRGALRERAIVRFVDDKKPAINVPVVANVLGNVQLSPAVLSFGVVSGAEAIERRVQWRSTSPYPVRIKKVRSSEPAVSAELVDIQPGKQGVLVVRLHPERFVTQLKATVTLTTDSKEDPELVLAVYAVKTPN
jgi:hypothetical protein